jgi:hypothetical protein
MGNSQAVVPGSRERFSTIRARLVANYYMADSEMETICPQASEKVVLHELLIRAHFDPDFRFELIWNVGEALANLPDGCPRGLAGVSFRDQDSPEAQTIKFDATEHSIHLMRPVWQGPFNRECLTAMID